MLELENITAGYGRTEVLHDVTIAAEGGITAVLGHNGAGKTTLLRVAMGLVRPSGGTVRWEGEDITSLAPSARVRRGIAYVPQGQQSFTQLTTRENLQLIGDLYSDGRRRLAYALDRFPALADMQGRKAGLLSGGQRQQLALARALMSEPRLLILDEPTEGIQPSVVAEIERTIMSLAEDGLTVLLVEQHIGFAVPAASRFSVLASGEIVLTSDGGADALPVAIDALTI